MTAPPTPANGGGSGSGTSMAIRVVVRIRPFLQNEGQTEATIQALDQGRVAVYDPVDEKGGDPALRNRSKERLYAFDAAFDGRASQKEIYAATAEHVVAGVMEGINATCFAYGATGSGKTHTMLGTEANPGVNFLTLQDLFRRIDEAKREDLVYRVTMSYLEIYNENIRDLLTGSPQALDLQEDPEKGMRVQGLSEATVRGTNDVMQLLVKGNQNRTQEATMANETSSRSHAVLRVTVEREDFQQKELRISKLSLIDLAGSERAARTQNQGQRLVEGANINRSLLALGNCINALYIQASTNKKAFVNYRDSKLTRLLKDSLGGNCRTVMIATVAPSVVCLEESVNTLKYANRAKEIKVEVTANCRRLTQQGHEEYQRLIDDLQSEIKALRGKLQETESTTVSNQGSCSVTASSPGLATTVTAALPFEAEELRRHVAEKRQLSEELSEIEAALVLLRVKLSQHTAAMVVLTSAQAGFDATRKVQELIATLNEEIVQKEGRSEHLMALMSALDARIAHRKAQFRDSDNFIHRQEYWECERNELVLQQEQLAAANKAQEEAHLDFQRMATALLDQIRLRDESILQLRGTVSKCTTCAKAMQSRASSNQDSAAQAAQLVARWLGADALTLQQRLSVGADFFTSNLSPEKKETAVQRQIPAAPTPSVVTRTAVVKKNTVAAKPAARPPVANTSYAARVAAPPPNGAVHPRVVAAKPLGNAKPAAIPIQLNSHVVSQPPGGRAVVHRIIEPAKAKLGPVTKVETDADLPVTMLHPPPSPTTSSDSSLSSSPPNTPTSCISTPGGPARAAAVVRSDWCSSPVPPPQLPPGISIPPLDFTLLPGRAPPRQPLRVAAKAAAHTFVQPKGYVPHYTLGTKASAVKAFPGRIS
eukprot:TRINITY_DN1742_c0_g1_i1.p1 TRINITY_DN1742_c0_g1~~TRINITY_DN1742_c0_g1_i1.p1  ORF type:complete len:882 (-),score=153.75 TRINITY_DN1742_c0_g1_i1:61-2706(-)